MLLPCAYYLHLNFWSSFKQQTGPFMTWLLPAPNWLKWESTGERTCEPGLPITSAHLPYGHSYLQERLGMVIQLCPQEKGESGCWWSQLAGFVSCAPYAVPFLAGNVSLPPSWLYGFYMLFQSHLSMHSFRSSFLTRVWVRYSLIASVVPKNLLQFYSYYSPIIYFLISPHTRPWGLWH